MKKLICLFILFGWYWFHSPPVWAPKPKRVILYIEKTGPIFIFNIKDPILRAFCYVESRFVENIVNKKTKARGLLQITPAMIRRVNEILKEHNLGEIQFTWKDAWDSETSMRIWYIVQSYLNPEYDIKLACKIWFGRGVQHDGMTWKDYYVLVKTYLDRQPDWNTTNK